MNTLYTRECVCVNFNACTSLVLKLNSGKSVTVVECVFCNIDNVLRNGDLADVGVVESERTDVVYARGDDKLTGLCSRECLEVNSVRCLVVVDESTVERGVKCFIYYVVTSNVNLVFLEVVTVFKCTNADRFDRVGNVDGLKT